MAQQPLILDPWSSLAYKGAFETSADRPRAGSVSARWMSERDRRRLAAYLVLGAYLENTARSLPGSPGEDPEDREERREYGDASLLLEQALSHLLGDEQTIIVPGASEYDPAEDEAGDADADPGDEAAAARAAAARATARAAWEVQERIRRWAEDEHFDLRMQNLERMALGIGDAVWLLEWDSKKQRPRLGVMDAGMYFPVLPDDRLAGDDYPEKVHFAWEVPGEDFRDGKPRLRRVTYELGPILPGFNVETGELELAPGDKWDAEGRVVRRYPWNDDDVAVTCYLTDATWILSDAQRGRSLDDLRDENAEHRADPNTGLPLQALDLGIDFIPVVHQPNTVAGAEHFGQSLLAKVLEVLDDLQSADTDAQRAAATTGSPMIALSGGSSTPAVRRRTGGDDVASAHDGQTVRPGLILRLGENGRADTIDTSAQLGAMGDRVRDLLGRLSRNGRIPDVALGTVSEESAQMSGVAIELRYGPLGGLIRSLRLARRPKYSLLLRFAQRMMMLADDYGTDTNPAFEVHEANVEFGSYMPRDLHGSLKAIAEAYAARIISLETAVRMGQAAGVPIEDVVAEIRDIERRDFAGAGQMMDAVNDPAAARRYLGLDPIAVGTPPEGPRI